MRRPVANLVTAVSLLAVAAVAALWWRSQSDDDELRAQWSRGRIVVGTEPSGLHVTTCAVADLPTDLTAQERTDGANRLAAVVWRRSAPWIGWYCWSRPSSCGDYLNDVLFATPATGATGFGFVVARSNGYDEYPRLPPPPTGKYRIFHLAVPFWFLLTLAGMPPAVRLGRRLRRRRAPGRCPICGCDLRATPERCPECGRAGAIR